MRSDWLKLGTTKLFYFACIADNPFVYEQNQYYLHIQNTENHIENKNREMLQKKKKKANEKGKEDPPIQSG